MKLVKFFGAFVVMTAFLFNMNAWANLPTKTKRTMIKDIPPGAVSATITTKFNALKNNMFEFDYSGSTMADQGGYDGGLFDHEGDDTYFIPNSSCTSNCTLIQTNIGYQDFNNHEYKMCSLVFDTKTKQGTFIINNPYQSADSKTVICKYVYGHNHLFVFVVPENN